MRFIIMGIISEEGWYKKDDLTHWISVFYCLCWDENALLVWFTGL